MTEPCPVMRLVLDMPAEWRGRFVPFSLIAARLSLSEEAVRDAVFARACQPGVYFADARDSPKKRKTHVASGSLIEPPRPQGVHDLGDRVTENNLMIVAGDETRQSRSTKRQVVAPRTAFTSRSAAASSLDCTWTSSSTRASRTTGTSSARATSSTT
jgi:hypothetical protein